MKNIVMLFLFCASCANKLPLTYYSYNSVIITRLNCNTETRLYYGAIKDTANKAYIKATYSGRDDLMGCFLVFNNNKSVTIIRADGKFLKYGQDGSLNLNDTINNLDFIKWKSKINGRYNNIAELSDILETEQLLNKRNKSNVKVDDFPRQREQKP